MTTSDVTRELSDDELALVAGGEKKQEDQKKQTASDKNKPGAYLQITLPTILVAS